MIYIICQNRKGRLTSAYASWKQSLKAVKLRIHDDKYNRAGECQSFKVQPVFPGGFKYNLASIGRVTVACGIDVFGDGKLKVPYDDAFERHQRTGTETGSGWKSTNKVNKYKTSNTAGIRYETTLSYRGKVIKAY